jgi:AcrR family transcriptional regulator
MAKKKRAILRAATVLFAEKGYTETSVAELARLTDSAEGTIFYHYKTKAGLFVAILADIKEGILSEFDAYMDSCTFENGIEMMEQVISFFLYLAGHHEEWFLLLQRHHPYEVARENEECREHLATLYNTLLDLFEGAILKGREDGSIADLPPKKTALLIFSMVNGLIWLKFNDLYDAASLYQELLASCRRMLIPQPKKNTGVSSC